MQNIKQYIKSISLTGDATGGTPMERSRDMGETVAAGPVRHSFVLHRFYRNINARSALSWRCSSKGGLSFVKESPEKKTFSLKNELKVNSNSFLNHYIGKTKLIRTSVLASTLLVVLLTSAILVPAYNSMSVTEAATGTAQSSSLTLDVSNSTASVDLSVDNSNGTFVSSDSNSSISFNVSTNNYTGYKLSLSGSNDNQTLVNNVSNSDGTYASLSSISGSVDENSFSANTSTAGDNYNGKWGYNLTINAGTPSDYLAAPTTTSTPLDETSSANASGSSNNYKIGIGARASYSQPSGTYTGTYILTVVPNAINYVITYEDPTDEATNIPLEASDSTSQTTITLDSTIPTRTGYTFIGWCLGDITTTSNVDTCTGTTYQPGASFGIDQTTENKPTLLAMWEKDYETIQNLASSSCVTSQATKVKDIRDGTVYEVQRLADGKCWLLDNLALDLVAYKNVLSASNTNATDAQLAYLKGTSTGTTYDQYAMGDIINWPTGTPSSNFSYSVPYQQTSYKDTTSPGGYATGKYGIYYNYCAASAGTYCYGDGTNWGYPAGNAAADICPKGWRMPTGGGGEYQGLYSQYNAYNAFVNVLRIPLSGYYLGSADSQGVLGYFWSSTWYDSTTNMSLLYFDTSHVVPAGGNDRRSGYSVRCVLYDYTYMQDVTKEELATLLPNSGDTTTLYDNRDMQAYTIGKLADGNYWLLDNLALDLVANKNVLSSANTNATDAKLAYLKGTSTGSTSDQYATSSIINWPGGTSSNYSYSVPYQQTAYKNTTSAGGVGYADGKYGIYYNYCAASAGTYCYGDGTNAGTPPVDTNATADICPKGWRMPTGGTTGEYQTLYNKYNTYNTFVAALHTPLAGYYFNGVTGNSRGYGYFWSSTYHSAVNMYYLLLVLDTSPVYPTTSNSRGYGCSVRCIFAS